MDRERDQRDRQRADLERAQEQTSRRELSQQERSFLTRAIAACESRDRPAEQLGGEARRGGDPRSREEQTPARATDGGMPAKSEELRKLQLPDTNLEKWQRYEKAVSKRFHDRLTSDRAFATQVKDLQAAVAARDRDSVKEIVSQMDFTTALNSAVFWSGARMVGDSVIQNKDFARERFCLPENQRGGQWTILEDTPAGRVLEQAKLYDWMKAEQADAIWASASRNYAASASGTAVVFEHGMRIPNPEQSDPLWLEELQLLKENKAVRNVITDEPLRTEGYDLFKRNEIDPRA